MELEVPPELPEAERRALLEGLEWLLVDQPAPALLYGSAWLEAALRENAGELSDGPAA